MRLGILSKAVLVDTTTSFGADTSFGPLYLGDVSSFCIAYSATAGNGGGSISLKVGAFPDDEKTSIVGKTETIVVAAGAGEDLVLPSCAEYPFEGIEVTVPAGMELDYLAIVSY